MYRGCADIKGVIWTTKVQEKVLGHPAKICKRKGMVSGTALAHPRTKIR